MMSQPACCLKKIKAEKERLIAEKKIKKQKPLPPINDEEKPFALPKGWEWCRLGEILYEAPRMVILLLKLNERQTHEF